MEEGERKGGGRVLGKVGGSKEVGRGERQLNYTNLVCAIAKIHFHSVYHTTRCLNLHHVCVFANKYMYPPFDVEKFTNCAVGVREEGGSEGGRDGGGREGRMEEGEREGWRIERVAC